MISQRRLFSIVVDVTMTPEIPLRPISLRVVITNRFFVKDENKVFFSVLRRLSVVIYIIY
ncbi:hypothetical protein GIB67_042865 [Kingdonia uniflora]|uniref:Uncharacterized protein n=1 Tax=Kingdonia uniflora TaxID=39325 RepID=A0A7J7NSP0_9MAGN|nr:hypothetical protein GIB67_042865 [Kingdonia uniflora]